MAALAAALATLTGCATCDRERDQAPVQAAPPPEPAAPAPTAEVERMLASVEEAPPLDAWRALGTGAGAALMALAADPQRDLVQRARAVSALAAFNDAITTVWLGSMLGDARAPPILRRKAAAALAHHGEEGTRALAARVELEGDADLAEAIRRALARSSGDPGPGEPR